MSGLTLLSSPIGNLEDCSLRLLATIPRLDLLACEDTRQTRKLLQRHGLRAARVVACHDHNLATCLPRLRRAWQQGQRVGYISDAGTPAIADPGYALVRAALADGVTVDALPGPCAAITALQLSGLPAERFFFAGFLSARSAARRQALAELAGMPATLIFYESPQRLPAMLADGLASFGPRPACVARELTKLHQEVRRQPLNILAADYALAGPPRGEVVVLIGGADSRPATADVDLEALIRDLLRLHGVKQTARIAAAQTGRTVRDCYTLALKVRDDPRA